jgi:hypothetical protein
MNSRRLIAFPKAQNEVSYQAEVAMSALGQKQTFALQNGMSALPPIADMCGAKRDVRFVPIADIQEFDSLC